MERRVFGEMESRKPERNRSQILQSVVELISLNSGS